MTKNQTNTHTDTHTHTHTFPHIHKHTHTHTHTHTDTQTRHTHTLICADENNLIIRLFSYMQDADIIHGLLKRPQKAKK